ncbi:hypothetical protein [Halorubellus sp. PRR65]|uniref:DUF7472 family protein n=1 Tax=Halorubellus sp. PRR65 TaxID=3098148 RepID=UPI002B261331|nr:hypothetical protein [Halorubellus sp. PRR65]
MDRQDWTEVAVSIGSVLVMLAIFVGIGLTYGDAQGVLTVDGGFVLAGAIMFFVLFMVGIGYGLAYFLKPDEDDNGNPA